MGKNYNRLFKIEPSKNNRFVYTVQRRNFSDKFQLVATVEVVPYHSYEISALKQLKVDELGYLENEFRKIAKLNI